jgi:hypothetical protein
MHSTLKLRESDPHDVFTIAPDIVPAAWADRVLADIARDDVSPPPVKPPAAGSRAAGAPVPAADRTFRATAANDIRAQNIPDIQIAGDRPAGPAPTGSRMKGIIVAFLFALCSAFAATGWQHYGAAAKQMLSAWMPPFALTSSLPPEPTGLAANPDTPDIPASGQTTAQAAPEDQAPPPPAPAQAADGAAPGAATPSAAPSADAAQLQSMARDLAAMGQEIGLLKATVAELKSAQQPVARDAAKTSDVRTSDLKPSLPISRPKTAAPPPRPVAAAPRRPIQTYPAQGYSAQGYPAQTYPAQAAAPPPSLQPAPAPPMLAEDGELVVRPPMPLH